MKLRILWVVFVCMTVHACVLLPIPHRRPLSPLFWGSVIDADSQEPVTNARIVVVDRFRGGTMAGSSDDAGQYEVGVTERATWFVIWPPLFEGLCTGTISVTHPEYEPQAHDRSWSRTWIFDTPCRRVKLDVQMKKRRSLSPSDLISIDLLSGDGGRATHRTREHRNGNVDWKYQRSEDE